MKKRIFCVMLIILLIVCNLTIISNALSFTATMKPSSTTVQEQTEFAVTVRVSNLDVGTNGINSLKGYLKYDPDVFETISESNIEGLNSWTASYDETTGKIELTKSSFVTSTQEVFQVTFKTKSDVSGKSGTISYNNIVASNSETDITATDISTSITVGTAEGIENTTNTNSTNSIVISANTSSNTNTNTTNNTNTLVVNKVNNNTTNNTNVVSGYVNTITNTSADEDMPYTGVSDTIPAVILIVIAIAIVFYIKIEKLNKDMM